MKLLACLTIGFSMFGASAVHAQSASVPAGAVVFSADRVGLPSAKKSFSLHLHIAFSQNSGTKLYADTAKEGMVKWIQAHPDWAIETRLFSNSVASLPGLLEEARAGRAADCANIVPEFFQAFKDPGYLKPITKSFSPDEIKDFFPYVQKTASFNNELHAFWFYTDSRVLFRRTDLVPVAPKTWDELQKSALAAKAADPKVEGFLFNGGRWGGTWADLIPYFWMQGGEWANEQKQPVFADGKNREYLLNLLGFVKGLVDSGASPKRVVSFTSYTDFVTAAKNGTVAMFEATDSQYAQLKETLPPEQFAKWALSGLPGKTADQKSTLAGGWSFGVLTNDAEKGSMCMDFLKTVYGPKFVATTGLLPSRASTYQQYPVYSTPAYKALAEGLQYGRPQPILPYTPAMAGAFQVMIGEVLTGSSTPVNALSSMATAVQGAYNQGK